ncbi:MAG: hypothetical protein C0603_11380 [Denitrovibrio sp.]|nr:MAG: hypothetical protein C0603_11380 [Denitrovibrio sp.]
MDIIVSKGCRIKVLGQIQSVNDSERLIRTISEVVDSGATNIHIIFIETRLLGSATVGYLVKLTCSNNLTLNIEVTDLRLFDLLKNMGLIDTLNVSHKSE